MPGEIQIDRLRRLGSVACVLIVACALATACGSGGSDEPDVSPTPEPTETPVVVATALTGAPAVGAAVWSSAVDPVTNAPTGSTPQASDAAIYAAFPIESLPAGSQLVASWSFNDTSLDALGSALRIDQDRVSGWVEFHIERTGTEPWPDGEYAIVLSDGTNELQRAMVTIS